MHEQLQQQLIEYFGSLDAIPQEINNLFEKVDEIYARADQSEKALQETEIKYRTLLENSSDVISIIDKDGIIQYQSPSLEKVFGIDPSELVGTELVNIIHPEDKRKAVHAFVTALRNPGEYTTFEFRVRLNSGEYRHVESVGVNTPNEEGDGLVYISSRDVTERKLAQKEQISQIQNRSQQITITNTFAREIANAKDIGELYRKIINSIVNYLHVDFAQLLRYNQVTESLILAFGSGVTGKLLQNSQYQVPIHNGVIGKAAGNKAPVLISDTSLEPNWVPTPNLDNTKSELAVPIILGNDLLGVIDIQSSQTEFINEDTQIVLSTLCSLSAVSIESIRLRTEMEERLRELDTLQKITVREGWESHQDIANISSYAYTFDLLNDQAIPATEIPSNIYSQDLSVRGENIGTLAVEETEENPLTDEDKLLLDEIAAEIAEALERARLFETSQRSAAELAILNEMGQAFTEELSPDAIIENIYTFASRLLEIEDFYVALYDEEKNQVTFPLAYEDDKRVSLDHPHWENWQPRSLEAGGGGLTGHIIRTRQPILIDRNAEQILDQLNIPYQRHGNLTQSWLGVPLAVGDRVIGMISCQSEDTPGLYNTHHQELLNAIASQAAVAIDNAQRFTEEQERAAQERLVRTITDQVRRGADIDSIMRIALEQLSTALGAQTSVIKLGSKDQLIQKIQKAPPHQKIEENGTNGDAPPENTTSDTPETPPPPEVTE